MSSKAKKILWVSGLVLLFAVIAVWVFFRTSTPEDFSYEGYIVGTRDSNGDIVILTRNSEGESSFTVKWYTKKEFMGGLTELDEGSYIKLNTAGKNSSNIKNFLVYEGFSMEGKIVFMEGKTEAYLLTYGETVNYYMLYTIIPAQESKSQLKTGTQVKVYYQYPLNASMETFVVDVIEPMSDITDSLTEEEIDYLERKGYTVAGN